MAERKPVVLVSGQLKELPAGDTLPPQTPATHSHATSDVTGLDAALAGKEPAISEGTSAQYWRGDKTWQPLTKSSVGLGNVDNTSDANKPVSTATQNALNGKIGDAPSDGKTYGRKDAAWAEVIAGGGDLIRSARTSNTALTAADKGALIDCSGTFTLAVTAAATLGDGWWCYVRNTGTGVVTLDPNGAETVDGVSTGPVAGTILLACNGTSFTAIKIGGFDTMQVLTSGTSWTCPLGVRNARMRMGGGGEGGYSHAYADRSGRNGHAGGYLEKLLKLAPGAAYTYAIGAAGTGVVGAAGTGGGSTSITVSGTTYSASGGSEAGPGTPTNADFGFKGGGGGNTYGVDAIGVGGAHPLGVSGVGAGAQGAGYCYGGAGCPTWGAGASGGQGVIILEY